MAQDRKLKIKVQLSLPPEREAQPEIVYLWDRIIAAFCLLLVAVVLIGFGINRFFFEEPRAEVIETIGVGEGDLKKGLAVRDGALSSSSLPRSSIITENLVVPAITLSGIEEAAEAIERPLIKKVGLVSAGADKQGEENTGAGLFVLPVGEVAAKPTAGNEHVITGLPDDGLVLAIQAPQAVRQTVFNEGFQSDQQIIFSPDVTRFTLARMVRAKEPVGSLHDVRFNSDDVTSVYAYSDIRGLQGESVVYRWWLNGSEVAKVKIRIDGNRWRSYSSKLIQRKMNGLWRVDLQTEEGELLARLSFQLAR